MAIREDTEAQRQGATPSAGENASDAILELPSCTIEDIDRGLFDLFDRDLPLFFTYRKKTRRVPVIFAAGERFALIARKKPLRDKNNALILPVISIMRSGLMFQNELGLASNQTVPRIIRKKLSRKDVEYQRLLNKQNLKNSDDLPSTEAFLDTTTSVKTGAKEGRIATRRSQISTSQKTRRGNLLDPELGKNIFEVIEMAPPQFVTATYEITVWAQYVQQMNNIVHAISSNMLSYGGRMFRLESKKGYKFTAFLDSDFSPGNNFDDFTDDERLIRTTFTVKVAGYILGETHHGATNRLRKILSAPEVTFEMAFVDGDVEGARKDANIPSGDAQDYILDTRRIEAPLPGQAIGGTKAKAPTDNRLPGRSNLGTQETALVGGTANDMVAYPVNYASGSAERGGSGVVEKTRVVTSEKNPFTGENEDVRTYVKTRTSRNGETIYREII
jgi:hypothetical protein